MQANAYDSRALDRFMSKVEKTSSCWNWKGSKTKAGAGIFPVEGTHTTSHRASYIFHIGNIPEGKRVTRSCRVVDCVNPAHLILEDDPRQKSNEQRFWEKVDIKSEDECWDWIGVRGGEKLNRSYGHFSVGKKRMNANRYSWEIANGRPVPDGMEVCHKCDRPCCVNPNHLFLGTHLENMADMVQKSRHQAPRGEKQHAAKLSENDVRQIRALHSSGMTQRELAKRYNMSDANISLIVKRKNWAHVV